MKTFICCLLFSICCSISFGQNYVPFPKSNAVWYNATAWNSGSQSSFNSYYNYLNGDTLINNITYHKIYECNDSTIPFASLPPPYINFIPFTGGGGYFGAIREDSSKHVFYIPGYPNPPGPEYLLYDFNLNVGDTLSDTLFITMDNPNDTITVVSIDSIFDGLIYRKRFNLSQTPFFELVSLIEGIGNTRGLTYNVTTFGMGESWASLLCFSDSIPKYTNLYYHLCSLTGIEENNGNKNNSFTLSPNPTAEILNLKSEQPILFPVELFVMDLQGRLMNQKVIYNNDDLSLNVKAFANGAYLLAIKNKESVLYRGMFSKQ